jgi:hypothetical protein
MGLVVMLIFRRDSMTSELTPLQITTRRHCEADILTAGIYPEWLVRLQDVVFEGLPEDERNDWHVQIADAIAARGRDWPIILHAIHAAILRVCLGSAGSSAGVVQAVIDLHERAARGDPVPGAEWSKAAAEAVWSAAEAAAFPEIRDAILAEIMRPA